VTIDKLPTFRDHERVTVVVETPAGSRIKYKYEPKTGAFELHKALALGFAFPFPFGFIPGTKGGDGDPIDVLLITTLDPALGTVAEASIIGALAIEQADGNASPIRNDRFLAVPSIAHEDRPITSLFELGPAELDDIERFFIESGARDGKRLRIVERLGPAEALRLVREAATDEVL
jgi:inorganic pyrophosphatase